MNTIAVINEKGGVGKTTTAVNLAFGLARLKYRILLLDMDPQSNATQAVGLSPADYSESHIGEALVLDDVNLEPFIIQTDHPNLSMIPASRTLRDAAHELINQGNPLNRLIDGLSLLQDEYDYVVIDLPPTIEVLQETAIEATDFFIVPVELSIFSLEGLGNLIIHLTDRKAGMKGWDFRVLPSRVEGHNKEENAAAMKELKNVGRYILKTTIRYNGKISSSQRAGQDIYSFAPVSRGARDFRKLSKEISNLWQPKNLVS